MRPNSARKAVGGRYDGALVVSVREPAENGRATEAALDELAAALSLPRRGVTLLRGATSRRKLVEVVGEDESRLQKMVDHLLDGG